ncbi:GDSL-type esterase/lipase family protein [Bacillus sp. V5-8f]|uniref:DUF459 domain-containing protein n=1 Tax=Bacillus sp. V5-8f TaxID=2053044 RepID=UPI000C77AAA5|nr:GDSL-type esterase/lipase family protein [Bacillus sp. V5-8f]PLT34433.1 hypothetical protein CUU64_09460 [Bacillus sp. V5-8f]
MKKLSIVLIIFIVISVVWFSFQSQAKKNDPIIMALGDSLTFGYGDKNGEGYVDGLENALNEPSSKEKFRVWNYGITGQETEGVLKQLSDARIKSKLDKADYFIVFIGTNDLINSNGGDLKKINHERLSAEKDGYIKNVKTILDQLKKGNKEAPILVLGLYNPIPEDRQIEKHIDDWDREIQDIVKKEKRAVFIPTNDLFKNKDKKTYFSDALHPNEKGYQLITERILERYHFER